MAMANSKLRIRRLLGTTAATDASNTFRNEDGCPISANTGNSISDVTDQTSEATTMDSSNASEVIRKQHYISKQQEQRGNISGDGSFHRYIRSLVPSSVGTWVTSTMKPSSSSVSIFSDECTEVASVPSFTSEDNNKLYDQQLTAALNTTFESGSSVTTTKTSESIFSYGSNGTDPFADVRERMESLSSKSTRQQLKQLQKQKQDKGLLQHQLEMLSDTDEDDVDSIAEVDVSFPSDSDTYDAVGHLTEADGKDHQHPEEELDAEKDSTVIAWVVYLGWTILIVLGRISEYLEAVYFCLFSRSALSTGSAALSNELYAPLLHSWESFFTRRIFVRFHDCFNRPIASNPGSKIDVLERVSYDEQISMDVLGPIHVTPTHNNTGTSNELLLKQYASGPHFTLAHDGSIARRCINLGSYNYLGFGDDWSQTCASTVKHSLTELPISSSSSPVEYGVTNIHQQLEETVARFLGKDDAIVFTMGFNTNATIIPALVTDGDLVISDKLNHTSIVTGARASGATIRIFGHNDMHQLEKIIRESILLGRSSKNGGNGRQSASARRQPWNKIVVVVEGIYSMEGEFAKLHEVVAICKKYGAYIYLDEAHSIGATGVTGRGCTEVLGVATTDIDLMMGTFTKSYGAMGGYIAGDHDTISMLRNKCVGSLYHNSLSPTVCQQVITSFKIIMGNDGTDIGRNKLHALRDNSNYFRMRLRDMGLLVLGQYDSPVMPIMVYHPSKLAFFSRELFKRGVAVVVVGFPAVPLLTARARICMSASHTRADLDYALEQINEVGELLELKYAKRRTKVT